MIEHIEKYVLGHVYYELRFGVGDCQRCFPEIVTFQFIGQNIAEEDSETDEILYFQYLENYVEYGSPLLNPDGNDDVPARRVLEVVPGDFTKILTPEELSIELLAIQDRNTERLK